MRARLAALLLALAAATGCGQMGPLSLPEAPAALEPANDETEDDEQR